MPDCLAWFIHTLTCADVNYALANLHSYAKEANGQGGIEEAQVLEEENKVLLEDDLVDDDDW